LVRIPAQVYSEALEYARGERPEPPKARTEGE
jgi:hypothetical protein